MDGKIVFKIVMSNMHKQIRIVKAPSPIVPFESRLSVNFFQVLISQLFKLLIYLQ